MQRPNRKQILVLAIISLLVGASCIMFLTKEGQSAGLRITAISEEGQIGGMLLDGGVTHILHVEAGSGQGKRLMYSAFNGMGVVASNILLVEDEILDYDFGMALDGNGGMHFSYAASHRGEAALYYGFFDGVEATTTLLDENITHSSVLILDGDGHPLVVYSRFSFDSYSGVQELVLARRNETGWNRQILEHETRSQTTISYIQMAADPSGVFHLSFAVRAGPHPDTSSKEQALPIQDYNVSGRSYLTYARFSGGVWERRLLMSTDDYVLNLKMTMTSEQRPSTIMLLASHMETISLVHVSPVANGTWQEKWHDLPSQATFMNVAHVEISIDRNDNLCLSWVDESHSLMYATFKDGEWKSENVLGQLNDNPQAIAVRMYDSNDTPTFIATLIFFPPSTMKSGAYLITGFAPSA